MLRRGLTALLGAGSRNADSKREDLIRRGDALPCRTFDSLEVVELGRRIARQTYVNDGIKLANHFEITLETSVNRTARYLTIGVCFTAHGMEL